MAEKLDSNGLPIVNVTGPTPTSDNYATARSDINKYVEQIPAQKQAELKTSLAKNFVGSPGLIVSSGLAGALPDNPILKAMAEVSQAAAQARKLTDDEAQKKLSTERFKNSSRGKAWTMFKGAIRPALIGVAAPIEFTSGLVNEVATFARGEKQRKNWSEMVGGATRQTTLYQVNEQINKAKPGWQSLTNENPGREKILGSGFFPNEETGAGMAIRKIALDNYSIPIMRNDKQVGVRPYNLGTPVAWVLKQGDIENNQAVLYEFGANFVASFYLDPSLFAGKVIKARQILEFARKTSTGINSAAKIAKATNNLRAAESEAAYITKLRDRLVAIEKSGGKTEITENQIKAAALRELGYRNKVGDLTVDNNNFATFLSGEINAPVIDYIAKTDSVFDIWKVNPKMEAAMVQSLAKAKTRDEVLSVFAPYVGRVDDGEAVVGGMLIAGNKLSAVKVAASKAGVGSRYRQNYVTGMAKIFEDSLFGRAKNNVKQKFNTLIPGATFINTNDTAALAENAYDWFKVGKVPASEIRTLMTRILSTESASERGYLASAGVMDAIVAANAENLSPRLVKELYEATRLFKEGTEKTASYWANQHIFGQGIEIMSVKGESVFLGGPHLSSELLNSYVYMPPAKEVMNLISLVGKNRGTAAIRDAGDFLIGNVWKKSVLVRVPYITRNIMEEQFRVSLVGHTSFFTNPLSSIAMFLGKSDGPAWRRFLARLDESKDTLYGTSFTHSDRVMAFENEMDAIAQKNSYINLMTTKEIGSEAVRKGGKFKIEEGHAAVNIRHPRAWEGIASQVRTMHDSPVARKIAGAKPGTEEKVIDYFLNGKGKKEYKAYVEALGHPEFMEPDWARAFMYNSKNAEGYATSIAARIEQLTGGSPQLKALIASGKVTHNGKTIEVPTLAKEATANMRAAEKMTKDGDVLLSDMNKIFADELDLNFKATGKWDDTFLVNVPELKISKINSANAFDRNVTEPFFNFSQKMEKLSTMGPEYRMQYWDAIRSITGALDSAALAQLENMANKSLPKIRGLRGEPLGKNHPVWSAFSTAKKVNKGDGVFTLDQAHEYASGVASKHVADLFYNATNKRQLFHAFRLVAPFAQAWADTIVRWSELGMKNPMQVYKITKTLDWLTKPESSSLYSLTDANDYYDPNQGFFFKNPKSGDREFYVPFAGTAMMALAKAAGHTTGGTATNSSAFAMSINPMSFNFAIGTGTLMPGIGPGLTLPLVILENVGLNPLRLLSQGYREAIENWLFPYGQPDTETQGLSAGLLSGNWNRILGPLGNTEAFFASAFKPIMAYLSAGGDYDLADPLDQSRLMEQTTTLSKWFTIMRGLTGVLTPIPAQLIPNALAKDEDGNTILQTALYEQFKKIEELNGMDKSQAYADFFDLYGPEQVFSIITQGAASSLDTYRMIDKDPSILAQYGDIFGYVFPNGGFSQEMYKWNLKAQGGKMGVDDLKNRALDMLRAATQDRLLTRATAENWSVEDYDATKTNLNKSFMAGTLSDNKRSERALDQIALAIEDPRFDDSDAIQGARDYMALREVVLSKLKDAGYTTMKNAASIDLRVWLANLTTRIIDEHPDFAKLFYAVFFSELGYNPQKYQPE